MDTEYDVVVVGAGPGGATAASFLGREGVRTLLVDKAHFPRDKSCGDAVCSKSVSLLRELGLEEQLSQVPGHRADAEVFLNARGEGLHLPFVTRKGRFASAPANGPREVPGRPDLEPCPAYVIAREIFDDLLFRHACTYASVEAKEGFAFTDFLREGGKVVGVVGQGEGGRTRQIRARIVIGADGAMSKVAEKAGAYDFHHKHHDHWIAAFRIYFDGIGDLGNELEIHFLDELLPGYLWIFPEGNGRANVGAGMVETFVRGDRNGHRKMNLRQLGYRLLAEHPRLKDRFRVAKEVPNSFLGWQLPCGSERRQLAGDGWMLIGDAGSLIDPFSGEGIANAMSSAKHAAQTAVRALAGHGTLEDYPRAVWDELGEELATSTRLQKLVRHTWLVKWLLHRAATRPRLQEEIRELKAHDEGGRLANPLYLARMLTR